MKKIEHILSKGDSFNVDTMACMTHAEKLKTYKRPIESYTWSSRQKDVQLTFKVAFISICHQFNWDVMQNALAKNLLEGEQHLVETLCNITSSDIELWLIDYPKKDRIRGKERAKILRDVGNVLKNEFGGDLKKFYNECEMSSLNPSSNYKSFHKIMDSFIGFRTDRLRKKTNVLSHDLIKENIVNFIDPQEAQPAIDYHIMRLYIRSGRVVPSDEAIFSFLEGAPNPRGTLVRQLRVAVSKAVQLVAHYANLNVADVNYIEWQLARNICTNKGPSCSSIEDPTNIPDDILQLCKDECPNNSICLSFNHLPRFIYFEEPIYISSDY